MTTDSSALTVFVEVRSGTGSVAWSARSYHVILLQHGQSSEFRIGKCQHGRVAGGNGFHLGIGQLPSSVSVFDSFTPATNRRPKPKIHVRIQKLLSEANLNAGMRIC